MQPTILPNLPPDLKELLKLFNDRGVRYLIIGGVAYGFYAQPRYTKDLDLAVAPDRANAARLHRALADFGLPLDNITESDLTEPTKFFRFGREPVAFDLLPGIPGLDFDQAWERRVSGVIDEATELRANLVSRDDLIASKLAAGRPRDLGDVDDIQRAAAATEEKSRKSS